MNDPKPRPQPVIHGKKNSSLPLLGMLCWALIGLPVLIVALAACPLTLPIFGGIGLILTVFGCWNGARNK